MNPADLAESYLFALQRNGVEPNFWCSLEYFGFRGILPAMDSYRNVVGNVAGLWGLTDPDTNEWFLPPILLEAKRFHMDAPYYCGFPSDEPPPGGRLLDVQYLYDPEDFQNLDGGKWQVFRKNIRKFARTLPSMSLAFNRAYRELRPSDTTLVEALLQTWADGREVFDPETVVKFALYGKHRWGLFRDETLIGINVADSNWRYVNYRLCLDNGEPFAQEYLRYAFYLSDWVRGQRKLVNDGGNLGSEGLARFKQKLNPRSIKNVYTTLPQTGDERNGSQQEGFTGSPGSGPPRAVR